MVYIVTGATSFIGLEFINSILSQGDTVIAVCRKTSSSLAALPASPRLSVVFMEMAEYELLDRKIPKADVFVNLAWDGTKNTVDRDFGAVHQSNVTNTVNAFKAASRMGCSLFVEAGSQAEYGIVHGPISEELECHPLTQYGKAKLEVKNQCFSLSEAVNLKYLHLRIFSLFGEGDHARTLVMSALDKMLRDEPVNLSSCSQDWNFLYVKDAVKQICLLCQYALNTASFRHEVFNIASADTRVLKDFVMSMHRLSCSASQLNFGALTQAAPVTLRPDVTKTRKAIGFISEHTFEEIIPTIINGIKNK